MAERLDRDGLPSTAIHGNKSQNARTRALADFKANKIRVLVATDIAARGLDISGLPQVVNFDLPNVPEDYVHRIGRTGRAGASGHALSIVSPDQKALLRGIDKLLGRAVPVETLKGFAPAQADLQPRDTHTEPQRYKPRTQRGNNAAHRHARPGNGQRRRRSGNRQQAR